MEANFEKATRIGLRFPSVKGWITVEDLWALPLERKDNFDLDNVARQCNAALKESTEESFVRKTTPEKEEHALRMAIVKHIIDVRLSEQEAKEKAIANKQEREKIMAALEAKQTESLYNMTEEQLQARLAAITTK